MVVGSKDGAEGTNSSDSLHAQHERILRQVSRIRECVFLPQLAEDVLQLCQALVVDGKVSFLHLVSHISTPNPSDRLLLAALQRRDV